jgi:hypothetical protein
VVTDLSGAIRNLGVDAAAGRDAQIVLARRLIEAVRTTAVHGSVPSTVDVFGWMTAAFGIAASAVLESAAIPSTSAPHHLPRGFTILDRSLTRC